MFSGLFRQNKKQQQGNVLAQNLYQAALKQARNPIFYTEHGVPDSFDGRFDMLLVNIFIILQRIKTHPRYEEIAQNVFDTTFLNMDQTLREMGIGDMGIPKHMKRMMLAFNGRMHVYLAAIDPDALKGIEMNDFDMPSSLEQAVRRNLYGTLDDDALCEDHPAKIAAYIRENIAKKHSADYADFTFIPPSI